MSEWKPIETAPKGEWVLLFEPDAEFGTVDMTHWIAKWRYSDWDEGWFDQDDALVVSNPTHWMPLPAPPQAE